jgi:hypothetical protein
MSEIVFVIDGDPDCGISARAVGESIFTQAATMAELHDQLREAVRCHFDETALPELIRLQVEART